MSDVLKSETIERDGLTYKVERILDTEVDLSHLGMWTDRVPECPYYDCLLDAIVIAPLSDGFVRTRDARGHLATRDARLTWRREYRYISDFQCPESVKACLSDAKRLKAYEAQEWYMVGIKVTLMLDGQPTDGEASLWGIESDSDESYFKEVADDRIAEIDAPAVLAALAKTHEERAEAARRALAKLAQPTKEV